MILLTAYWPTLRNNSYLVINFLPACLFTVFFHSKIVKVVLRIMSINALHSKLTQLLTETSNLGLHLGFSAKLKILQVPACKMEPQSGFLMQLGPPTHPPDQLEIRSRQDGDLLFGFWIHGVLCYYLVPFSSFLIIIQIRQRFKDLKGLKKLKRMWRLQDYKDFKDFKTTKTEELKNARLVTSMKSY